MSSPDPALVNARIDQAMAAASTALDRLIARYRDVTPTAAEAFDSKVAIVRIAVHKVDPEDQLPTPLSNELTFIGEMLATAVSRLATQKDTNP